MKNSRRKIILAVSVVFVALAITWVAIYIFSGVSEAITLEGYNMKDLWKEWQLDGSPEPPPVEKYTAHSTDLNRFFVWTNAYVINGQTFQSLFAMDDPRFEGKGILIISKNGQLIWLGKKEIPKIIKNP